MAREKEEREDQVTVKEQVKGDSPSLVDTLNRFREYVIKGKIYRCDDDEKDYVVRLSKDTKISVHLKGKEQIISLTGKTNLDCDHVMLRELVLRSIQEGPTSMKQKFEDRTGDPRSDDPLVLTLISATERKGSRFNYLKGKVPELNV